MEFRSIKCGILFAVCWLFVTSLLLAWFFIVPCYVNGPLIQSEASEQSSFETRESENIERPGLRGSKENLDAGVAIDLNSSNITPPSAWASSEVSTDVSNTTVAPAEHARKYAYVWYLANSSSNIACAILVAAASVQRRPDTDLVTIWNRGVPGLERFQKMGIKLIQVKDPVSKGKYQWTHSFVKLRTAELFQYQRVIYFDVDAFPLGSMDNLFEIAPFPVELAAPRAYWLKQPQVQSGGPMVIDPRRIFYKRDFSKPMEGSVGYVAGEMDWVNKHFINTVFMLDGFYALLIGEWCGVDGAYRYWQKHYEESPEWVLQHAVLVHFISDWKPWLLTNEAALKKRCIKPQPQLLQIYQKWWDAKEKYC
eukprot:s2161_g7.t1